MSNIKAVAKYRKTLKGFFSNTYKNQRTNNKRRFGIEPEYSKQELEEWFLSQKDFMNMYKTYIESEYDTNLKPSADRRDDMIHYKINNIQLMTWGDNRRKGHDDRISGENSKQNQKIIKKNINGIVIQRFYSMSDASRQTQLDQGGISRCCNGKQNTCGGFMWEFDGEKTVRKD